MGIGISSYPNLMWHHPFKMYMNLYLRYQRQTKSDHIGVIHPLKAKSPAIIYLFMFCKVLYDITCEQGFYHAEQVTYTSA